MAIINIGNILVDFSSQSLRPFPSILVKEKSCYLFILQTVPVTLILSYGYFVVVPELISGIYEGELNTRIQFYPKGIKYTFIVAIPDGVGSDAPFEINVLPKPIYRGRTDPRLVTLNLQYDNKSVGDAVWGNY